MKDTEDRLMLEEKFYPSSKKNACYVVQVRPSGIHLIKTVGSVTQTKIISLDDVIGCRCTRRRRRLDEICVCHPGKISLNGMDVPDPSAYLHVYAYVMKAFRVMSGRKRERYTITLQFQARRTYDENLAEARRWKTMIRRLLDERRYIGWTDMVGDSEDKGKLLVILNPKSGAGKSRQIFQERVVPLLIEADLEYDLHITKKQNDARNLIKTSNVLKWKKGIVVIGGDGVLYEVINGVLERPDWKKILATIPFGIIPGGSGNGLAKSLSARTKEPYDENPVLISLLSILKGNPIPVDLVRIENHTEVVFSILSLGWGLIADIDIESERLRALGSPRFAIWSISKIVGLRTYTGRLSFLRVPEEKVKEAIESNRHLELQIQDLLKNEDDRSMGSFDMDSISLDTGFNPTPNVMRTESFYSLTSHKSTYHSVGRASSYLSLPDATRNQKTMYGPSSQLPSLNHPVPKCWEVYQGEFVLVHATYQSHLAGDVFFAPHAKPHDGIIWLLIIKAGITRINLLQFLMNMSTGTHVNQPEVEMIPVLAFRLEPLCKGSYIVIDGELVDHGAVQAEIFPGLINLFNRETKQ